MMEDYWWINALVDIAGQTAILVCVLVWTLRFRQRSPRAVRLVMAALAVNVLVLSARAVESLCWALKLSFFEFEFPAGNQGPDLSDPFIQFTLVKQLCHALGGIASWSLLAWAALRRPDERRTKELAV